MRWIPAIALSLGLLPSLVQAAEGRTPIYRPTIITQPGHYFLTQDISGASPVLRIQASNVTLDLNGRTVSTTSTNLSVIDIDDGFTDIAIANGRLTGANWGVFYFSVTTPIRLRLERLDVQNQGTDGIHVFNAEAVDVVSCRIVSSVGGDGIIVIASSSAFAGHILDNTIDGTANNGITLDGINAGVVRGNVVRDFSRTLSGSGIWLTQGNAQSGLAGGNIVQGNAVGRTIHGVDGIAIGSAAQNPFNRNLVIGNTVTGTSNGITLYTSGNLVSGNVVSGGNHGIAVAAGNNDLIEENQIQGNGGCGIFFVTAGAHAYKGNMLRGNTGGAVCGPANTDAGGNIL